MPSTALKHLAKKADVSLERVEHLWDKAKTIVSAEYPKSTENYYALVMGVTKKMLGLNEALTENEMEMAETSGIATLIATLLDARDSAHILHWKVKSLSLHLALRELYDSLLEFADELAEMYMGKYGTDIFLFRQEHSQFEGLDPYLFIVELQNKLVASVSIIPDDGFLINKYEELQGVVAKIAYKIQNLK